MVEKAKRYRTCHNCGRTINREEIHVRIYNRVIRKGVSVRSAQMLANMCKHCLIREVYEILGNDIIQTRLFK